MELKNFYTQDTQGNILPGAQVYVYDRGTLNLVSGVKDATGGDKTNPFPSDGDGLATFAVPNGLYDIRVVTGERDTKLPMQFFDVADGMAEVGALVDEAEAAQAAAEAAASSAASSAGSISGLVQVTPAPDKVPKADPTGKIHIDWIPPEVVRKAELMDPANGGAGMVAFKFNQLYSAIRTVYDKLADEISVKDFDGIKGDGVNDDTAGWQKAIEYACGPNPGGVNLQGHVALYIPPGQYKISSLVKYVETTNRKINLRIRGAGSHQSTIMVADGNTQGFLEVGVVGGNEGIFQLSDFTIIANGPNNGTPLKLYVDPVGLSRNRRCILQNISVRPNAADGQWFNKGIIANGFYYPIVDNCSVSGVFGGTASSTAYQDTSPGYYMDVGYDLTDCYDPTIRDSFAWSCKVAYELSNTVDPGSEGGFIIHSGASRVLTGLRRHTVGREPGFIVTYCHFNYRDSGIDLMNLKDVELKNNMIYNENAGQVGTGPTPVDIRMQGCQDVTINGCRHQFTGDPRRDAVSIDNSFGNTEGRQEHRALNYVIEGNDYATTALRNLISVYGVSDRSLGRVVLKSFNNNQWIDSAIGVTTQNIIYMPNGGDPVGWTRIIDGTFGVYKQDGSRVFAVTPKGHVIQDEGPMYVPAERSLVRYRQKRADVLQGDAFAKTLWIGDSTFIAVGAKTVSAPFPRKYSFPSMAVKRLADLNAIEAGPYGTGGWSGPNYNASDARVSVGSGWTWTLETLGGGLLENGANANPIQFTPGFQWDTAEIFFASDAAATGNFGAAGSTVPFSLTGGSIEKRTFNMGSLTSANFLFQRTTGTVRVVGYTCYNSAKPGVIVQNAGRSGWRADQAADTTAYYSPLNAAVAVAPDLAIVGFGLNEWNQNIAPATFKTNLTKIVETLLPVCSVALYAAAEPTGTKTYPWSAYRKVIHELAATKGIPVCDVTALLGPAANNTSWMRDALHPTSQGYGEIGFLVEKLLRI